MHGLRHFSSRQLIWVHVWVHLRSSYSHLATLIELLLNLASQREGGVTFD